MSEKKYKVIDKFGHVLADNMSLDIALVLVKGYANEYCNELLSVRIEEDVAMDKETEKKSTPSHWC